MTRDHGMGGYITQALGLDRAVDPDVVDLETPAGVRLLLCTDGLSNMVDDGGIGRCSARATRSRPATPWSRRRSTSGGIDNVTVIVAAF